MDYPKAANDNRNLQIPVTPYQEATINQSWNNISKKLSTPDLKVVK